MAENSKTLIVMGVCGVGKTSVARALADAIPAIYIEADDFHPIKNIEAMSRGEPLTDEMRTPWLRGIGEEVQALRKSQAGQDIVVACSALKRSYRDLIRSYAPDAKVIFLNGPKELIHQRMASRSDHFMPTALLESQLATLEPPSAEEDHLKISIEGTRDDVVSDIVSRLSTET